MPYVEERRARPYLLLDTETLVRAHRSPASPARDLLQFAATGDVALCTSNRIVAELAVVLDRPEHGCSPAERDELCQLLETAAERYVPLTDADIIPGRSRDPGDDHVVAAWTATGAELLVTANRKDFAQVPGLVTSDAGAACRWLREQRPFGTATRLTAAELATQQP